MSPLIYILHSGSLFGTERMALATLEGLREDFAPLLLAPPGAALEEAARLGLEAEAFHGRIDLVRRLWRHLGGQRQAAVLTTSVTQSLLTFVAGVLRRCQLTHLLVVHGGAGERLSYGRKVWVQRLGVRFVAVSDFVRQRLLAHGVRPEYVKTIENFLPAARAYAGPRRPAFVRAGIQRVALVTRLDAQKRVDLLFDALDRCPELRKMRFDIYGSGALGRALRARGAACDNVYFHGFHGDVPAALAEADLLLHTCPTEPFGLVVLEAMASGVPVLVPDTGGAGDLVIPGLTGLHYRAVDAEDLAARLLAADRMLPWSLNAMVHQARLDLAHRFGRTHRLDDYRRHLLTEVSAP